MDQRVIDSEFGVILMEGEELILSLRPTRGFVTLYIVKACITIVGVLLLPLVIPLTNLAYSKARYWLTNRRVIIGWGIIGYCVRSIPLERVSDVALSRSVTERLAEVTSIVVRDMTGEAEAGASLVAIENAAEVQMEILDQVRRVNSERTGV